MTTSVLDLIYRKRNGGRLNRDQIDLLVDSLIAGTVSEAQVGAMLMAIFLRGLSFEETADLTMAMVRSGSVVDLSAIDGFKADKHSTGGVGDKVTLVLGPLVAAAGVKFPKLSGRGLAHTGGTLDKLEAIPGMRVDLSLDEFIRQVEEIGIAITGQTQELVPADGILYAMRDHTGTVESIPLIASSVMSKKIAAGADGIVLDVKCGQGAFMKSVEQAMELSRQMVSIGTAAGKETVAMVTSMETPLGFAVGNALEVAEAIDTLSGSGPRDLYDEVMAIASRILLMAGVAQDTQTAITALEAQIASGKALKLLEAMIVAQGGNAEVVRDRTLLPHAVRIIEVTSPESGYVQSIDALAIGSVAMDLGAGRQVKGEMISPSAGVILREKPVPDARPVERGQALAELHLPVEGDKLARVPNTEGLKERVRRAYALGPRPPAERPVVLGVVDQGEND
jgi:pyrimidine-nucleoside phosphorylase